MANREALDALVAESFRQRDREANIARLDAARIAYGRLSDLEDLSHHPQNRLIRVETENGPVEILSPGAVVAGESPALGPVPGLGQHDRNRGEHKDGRHREADACQTLGQAITQQNNSKPPNQCQEPAEPRLPGRRDGRNHHQRPRLQERWPRMIPAAKTDAQSEPEREHNLIGSCRQCQQRIRRRQNPPHRDQIEASS